MQQSSARAVLKLVQQFCTCSPRGVAGATEFCTCSPTGCRCNVNGCTCNRVLHKQGCLCNVTNCTCRGGVAGATRMVARAKPNHFFGGSPRCTCRIRAFFVPPESLNAFRSVHGIGREVKQEHQHQSLLIRKQELWLRLRSS